MKEVKKIKHKWYYVYDVIKRLNVTEEELLKALKNIKRRHPYEHWILERTAQNGQFIININVECALWLEEVYYNDSKFYLDLEIEFFERRVKALEEQLKVEPKVKQYRDMSVLEIMDYFWKTRNSVDVAIHKMVKVLGEDVRYRKDNKVMIKDYGIKWLDQKYYRLSYLNYLENYKLKLDELY